ncbi:MAG: ImmA/IrrE family metallo-endopeptidase [Rubrobacter sp.]
MDAVPTANRFASEFLLPEQSIRHELYPPITLSGLSKLKPRWGVSIQALIRRAYTLEIITQRQYKYLFQKLSARGWRTKEPDELAVKVEKPRAARQMAELLYGVPYGDQIDFKKLAEDVNLTEQFVKEILDAHASKRHSLERRVEPERGQLLRLKDSQVGAKPTISEKSRLW